LINYLKNIIFIRASGLDVLLEGHEDDGGFEVVAVEDAAQRREEPDCADGALVNQGSDTLTTGRVPKSDVEILKNYDVAFLTPIVLKG
jgi:hypothetical protein